MTDMDFDRKNSEMQRHCDLLNITKVFNGRVQTWPGATKDTSAKVQGEYSLSEWDPGITGYLPGPAVYTGLGRGVPGFWVVPQLKDID